MKKETFRFIAKKFAPTVALEHRFSTPLREQATAALAAQKVAAAKAGAGETCCGGKAEEFALPPLR